MMKSFTSFVLLCSGTFLVTLDKASSTLFLDVRRATRIISVGQSVK